MTTPNITQEQWSSFPKWRLVRLDEKTFFVKIAGAAKFSSRTRLRNKRFRFVVYENEAGKPVAYSLFAKDSPKDVRVGSFWVYLFFGIKSLPVKNVFEDDNVYVYSLGENTLFIVRRSST